MPKATVIKFKDNGKVHYIKADEYNLQENSKLVVLTTRGKELATVVKPQVDVNEEIISPLILQVERIATEADVEKDFENKSKKHQVLETSRELVKSLKLNMKFVDAEFTLDGGKVIISFVCDDRVDFRDLVKELANTLKMRIELKQIGTRDHAKLVGGVGPCGQECCCIRFLNDFDKVSVKMAKVQNLSLNPAKISGICGRLMCCLSHENDQYVEVSGRMPKVNTRVKTSSGDGVVIYNDLLKEKCTVKIAKGDEVKILEFPVNEIKFDKESVIIKSSCKYKTKKNNAYNEELELNEIKEEK